MLCHSALPSSSHHNATDIELTSQHTPSSIVLFELSLSLQGCKVSHKTVLECLQLCRTCGHCLHVSWQCERKQEKDKQRTGGCDRNFSWAQCLCWCILNIPVSVLHQHASFVCVCVCEIGSPHLGHGVQQDLSWLQLLSMACETSGWLLVDVGVLVIEGSGGRVHFQHAGQRCMSRVAGVSQTHTLTHTHSHSHTHMGAHTTSSSSTSMTALSSQTIALGTVLLLSLCLPLVLTLLPSSWPQPLWNPPPPLFFFSFQLTQKERICQRSLYPFNSALHAPVFPASVSGWL